MTSSGDVRGRGSQSRASAPVRQIPLSPLVADAAVNLHLGNQLLRRRQALGLTQQQVGQAIGVGFQQIHKYESGLSRIAPERLWALASALDVPVTYFFDGLHVRR